MEYQDKLSKQYNDFHSFLLDWGEQVEKVKHILSYLNTYPDTLEQLDLTDLHEPSTVDSELEEWVHLCEILEHPLEKDFFKPYWIPIVKKSLYTFIDLSNTNFPIFEIDFIFYEPFQWRKKYVIDNIEEILLGSNFDGILSSNEEKNWEEIQGFYRQRRILGLNGDLKIDPVSKDEIELDEGPPIQITQTPDGAVVLSNTTSLCIGLLPFDYKIKLDFVETDSWKVGFSLEDPKTIKDLVFLFREEGLLRISSFSLLLEMYPDGSIVFAEKKLSIYPAFEGSFELLTGTFESL
ncbi:MAG: hypothetical protein JW801_06935 [Bacteroidales bacterium]|nr:hypothetical protein [Bacteroidales bacterium]